jgi:hypothetical protein
MDNIQFNVEELGLLSSTGTQQVDDKKKADGKTKAAVAASTMQDIINQILAAGGIVKMAAADLEQLAAVLSDLTKDAKAVQDDLKNMKTGDPQAQYQAFVKLMKPGGDLDKLKSDKTEYASFIKMYRKEHHIKDGDPTPPIFIMKGLPSIDLKKLGDSITSFIGDIDKIHGQIDGKGKDYSLEDVWKMLEPNSPAITPYDERHKNLIDQFMSGVTNKYLNSEEGKDMMADLSNISGTYDSASSNSATGAQKDLTNWSQVLQILMKFMTSANAQGDYYAQHGTSS